MSHFWLKNILLHFFGGERGDSYSLYHFTLTFSHVGCSFFQLIISTYNFLSFNNLKKMTRTNKYISYKDRGIQMQESRNFRGKQLKMNFQ